MLAILTTSRKIHQIATGFDQASQPKLIGTLTLVINRPRKCNNTDTIGPEARVSSILMWVALVAAS
jgi:hypothetical protein